MTNQSLGPNVHGVFADNGLDAPPTYVSPARAQAMLRGQQELLDQVRRAGKWIIFNGLRYATTAKGTLPTRFRALLSDQLQYWLMGRSRISLEPRNPHH